MNLDEAISVASSFGGPPSQVIAKARDLFVGAGGTVLTAELPAIVTALTADLALAGDIGAGAAAALSGAANGVSWVVDAAGWASAACPYLMVAAAAVMIGGFIAEASANVKIEKNAAVRRDGERCRASIQAPTMEDSRRGLTPRDFLIAPNLSWPDTRYVFASLDEQRVSPPGDLGLNASLRAALSTMRKEIEADAMGWRTREPRPWLQAAYFDLCASLVGHGPFLVSKRGLCYLYLRERGISADAAANLSAAPGLELLNPRNYLVKDQGGYHVDYGELVEASCWWWDTTKTGRMPYPHAVMWALEALELWRSKTGQRLSEAAVQRASDRVRLGSSPALVAGFVRGGGLLSDASLPAPRVAGSGAGRVVAASVLALSAGGLAVHSAGGLGSWLGGARR